MKNISFGQLQTVKATIPGNTSNQNSTGKVTFNTDDIIISQLGNQTAVYNKYNDKLIFTTKKSNEEIVDAFNLPAKSTIDLTA